MGGVLHWRPHSRTSPGEADERITPPAVTKSLWCVEYLEPADRNEVFPGGLDIAEVDPKDVGNPGRFAPPAADAATIAVVEAAE